MSASNISLTQNVDETISSTEAEDTSKKGRSRRTKKPEIEIYRPGALRHQRSNRSTGQEEEGKFDEGIIPNSTNDRKEESKEKVNRKEGEGPKTFARGKSDVTEKVNKDHVKSKVTEGNKDVSRVVIETTVIENSNFNKNASRRHASEWHENRQRVPPVGAPDRRKDDNNASEKYTGGHKNVKSKEYKLAESEVIWDDRRYAHGSRKSEYQDFYEKPNKKHDFSSSNKMWDKKETSGYHHDGVRKKDDSSTNRRTHKENDKTYDRENSGKDYAHKHTGKTKDRFYSEKMPKKNDNREYSESSFEANNPASYDRECTPSASRKNRVSESKKPPEKVTAHAKVKESRNTKMQSEEPQNSDQSKTSIRHSNKESGRHYSKASKEGGEINDHSQRRENRKEPFEKAPWKAKEFDRRSGLVKQPKFEKSNDPTSESKEVNEVYKRNDKAGYRSNFSTSDIDKGGSQSVKKQDKLQNEPSYVESKKKKDTVTVSELAEKVDELAFGKFPKGADSKKRGKKGEKANDYKDQMHAVERRMVEDEQQKSYQSDSPDKTSTQETNEKSSKAKSYSGSRENRRNRGASKNVSQDGINTPGKRELKADLDVKGTFGKHDNESNNPELQSRFQSGSNTTKGKRSSETDKKSRAAGTIKSGLSKSVSPSNVQDEKENYAGANMKRDVISLSSFDNVSEDWGEEVDKAMMWNSPQESSRIATWEDEKSSWRPAREKPQRLEPDEPPRRLESPGHKAGLIQLTPTTSSSEVYSSTPTSSHQALRTSPVHQKQLYNPNNPSKPVLVVPSPRDLPSRDGQREASKSGGDTSGSPSCQVSHLNEYGPEGYSQKLDPSILYNIQRGEMDINYYVSSNQLPVEFRRIMDIRRHLQVCYKQLLVSDIRLCQEKNIENSLWKTLYYVIIEKLREYINRSPNLKDRSLSTLLMVVEEGHQYLQDLLEALQQEYGFTLEDHLEDEGTTSLGLRGRVRLALISAQKLLLSLGDLARYREQYSSNPNYAVAKKWYQMALQVHPRNGRPFNQLAIIAVNQKRPLDVVYYYVRSLTASNPFMSARDSLISMFDDIRKKYEAAKRNEPNSEGANPRDGRAVSGEGLRQEIWIRPDSGVTNRRTLSQSNDDEDKKEEELKKLPLEQLMKRFLTSYLHCHGMLFSRVGLDVFRDCCVVMLQEFSVLLQATPPRLSTNHLLQILAINMYAVNNTELKDSRVGSGYRSAAQELALVLAQEMFGRVAQQVVELLRLSHQHGGHGHHHPPESSRLAVPPEAVDPQRLFTPDLAHFMPPLKAWCDWLLYHSAVWNPPPPAHHYTNAEGGGGTGCWGSVADLATLLRGFGAPDVVVTEISASSNDPPPATTPVPLRLSEDTFLRGYQPLLPAHSILAYTAPMVHTGRACDWVRVMRLKTCLCQFLCGVDPPVLRLQKTDQGDILVSVVDTSPRETPTPPTLSLDTSEDEVEDSLSESEGSEEEVDAEAGGGGGGGDGGGVEEENPLASTVRLLTQRKKLLEKKQRQQRKLQTLLEGSVTLEMEIRPRYLVPDTNCFIEHLDVVTALVASGPYTVMVPLVVLNELDGLSRDAAVGKYGSEFHAVRVQEGAAAALCYLRNNTKHPALKCVTSQGSVLSSTTFTAEIDTVDATNDDKILSCCVHFCSDSTQRRPITAGVRRLYREVVLLTEDRNLRVKAHARDVPVRDLLDFARWAGVS